MAHIRDADIKNIIAILRFLHTHSVIKISGISSVDGDDRLAAQIFSAFQIRFIQLFRNLAGFFQDLF